MVPMSRTDHVLDAIDSAVADYTVSADAMRSAPDRGPEWTYERRDGPVPVVEVQRFGEPWGAFLADSSPVVDLFAGFVESMRRAAEVVVRDFGRMMRPYQDGLHGASVALLPPDAERKHRPRCRTCNPHGNLRPLPVNGPEYSRRRRNRGKRR